MARQKAASVASQESAPIWAARLKMARELTGLTQTSFAATLGLSQQRYNHYEAGIREPDAEIWAKIIRELRSRDVPLTLDYIIAGLGGPAGSAKHIKTSKVA